VLLVVVVVVHALHEGEELTSTLSHSWSLQRGRNKLLLRCCKRMRRLKRCSFKVTNLSISKAMVASKNLFLCDSVVVEVVDDDDVVEFRPIAEEKTEEGTLLFDPLRIIPLACDARSSYASNLRPAR